MAEIIDFKAGDFSFLVAPGGPFSAGVRANKGFALHRARFARPVPMMDGFARIKQHLEKLGRPVTALAACELRSPKPMSVQEFQAFNSEYLKTLHAWGCRARRDQRAGAQQHRADHRGAVRLELLRLHLHRAGRERRRRFPDLGPAGDQATARPAASAPSADATCR